MTEYIIGIKGKDFVLVGADQTAARSVIVYQQSYDKIYPIGKKTAMAGKETWKNKFYNDFLKVCGEVGDTNFFQESIAKNIALYEMRNGYDMTPNEAACFTRHKLATSLRSRKSYQVKLHLFFWNHSSGEPAGCWIRRYWGETRASFNRLPRCWYWVSLRRARLRSHVHHVYPRSTL